MAYLLSRLWVTVICLHLLALHQQPAHPWLPLPWLTETVQGGEGNWGRDAWGWRYLVLWVWQQGGPQGDHGCWVYKPGHFCSGPSARVRMQLWLKGRCWQSLLWGCQSCSALLRGGGPHPWLRAAPGAALGGIEQGTQVCQALGVIFFSHKTALKKEMRSGLFCGWDWLWRAASCLPLLCCNTGNLLLLTPGVVSNSQMVLTSVSGNWWPTCLTL